MAQPLPDSLKGAFLGEPSRIQLPRGSRLYKFVSYPVVRQSLLASPWWISPQAFDVLQARATRLDVPVREVARAHLAIAEEWSPGMDLLWGIVLAGEVEAWTGRARSQPVRLADPGARFLGGGDQLCVPGLGWQDIAMDFSAQWTR
jgi:hypothetical protein